MPPDTNSPPFRTIDLDEETFNFILDNCDANIVFGLESLQMLQSQDLVVKMVAQIEMFKKVRELFRNAK